MWQMQTEANGEKFDTQNSVTAVGQIREQMMRE
ncbi:hypothetical protein LMG28688_03952 [Paraburkholderia caffeinitolerans]|uniref:Uncharacterized protein n=1 Tax=Paraburkholderia caffeinitolerans TaxID=1723730 RepID=A0A6J5G7R5_9BURK|nr:hypothetical protein LMG28688_03952 [Paraburkholderia caffeinitolerans]